MKKQKIPTFDELKDDQYEYRYSRAERLSMRRNPPQEEQPLKPVEKIFGRNRGFRQMLVFFVLVSVFMWIAYFMLKNAEEMETRRVFRFDEGRRADVRLVAGDNRYGLNLAFENRGREEWSIRQITVRLSNWTWTTNLEMDMQPEGFDAYFVSIPRAYSNISKLVLELE